MCPRPELHWECWCKLQSCSPQSQVRGGTGTAFSKLFPHSRSRRCRVCGGAGGAAPPRDPHQELQLLVPVPVLTKTWHYPQPQLAKLPCDIAPKGHGSWKGILCTNLLWFGFFIGFDLESKTRCSGVGSFPLEKRLSWLLLCSESEHLKADLLLKMAGESPVVFPGHRMILVFVGTIMTLVWNTETALAEQVQPGTQA